MALTIHCIDSSNNNDRCFNALFEVLNCIRFYEVTKSTEIIPNKDIYITNNIAIIPPVNKPCIYFMSYNPFVSDIEAFVYNKSSKTLTNCTQIWIQDVYKEYKEYVETIYKVPVIIVPFMYGLNDKLLQQERKNDRLDIILYESNKTFNESALKSLYICEEMYMRHPTKIGTIYLFNIPSNDIAPKMLDSFTLWKDKKLRIFSNIKETDILNFFSNSTNYCVFLSNAVLEHISPFMYDIVNQGFPLMHTQSVSTFPYGTYYDKNNIDDCISQLISYKEIKPNQLYSNEEFQKHKLFQIQAIKDACDSFFK